MFLLQPKVYFSNGTDQLLQCYSVSLHVEILLISKFHPDHACCALWGVHTLKCLNAWIPIPEIGRHTYYLAYA